MPGFSRALALQTNANFAFPTHALAYLQHARKISAHVSKLSYLSYIMTHISSIRRRRVRARSATPALPLYRASDKRTLLSAARYVSRGFFMEDLADEIRNGHGTMQTRSRKDNLNRCLKGSAGIVNDRRLRTHDATVSLWKISSTNCAKSEPTTRRGTSDLPRCLQEDN